MRGFSLVLALALVVAGCGSGSAASPTIGKYTQTWTKPYGDTTCDDWGRLMDLHQQYVMAGDMLLSMQRGDDPGVTLPPDNQIGSLQHAIGTACEGPGAEIGIKVTEVAASIYLLASDLKP